MRGKWDLYVLTKFGGGPLSGAKGKFRPLLESVLKTRRRYNKFENGRARVPLPITLILAFLVGGFLGVFFCAWEALVIGNNILIRSR